MDNNKCIGPCSTPVPLLKILKTHISLLLSSLINDSFLCGIFPNKLKLATVTSVFKALDKTKIIIGQYQCYLFWTKCLKKRCISSSMVILNVIIFSTHFSFTITISQYLLFIHIIQVNHWMRNFVNPVQTTQYSIHSLCYTGTTLWNSLAINVKQNTPFFFRFCQNIKNSMTDGYYSGINS